MERHAGKPVVVALCCLLLLLVLLPLAASVPVSRSRLRLGSQQQHPPALELAASSQEAAMNMGRPPRPAARVAVEVNDYQPSGPNNKHDPPKGPGRA
ncbi:hypothetical protein BS78_09G178700 [Paspalum vaginatum]|nr:hypothetical protein BS78_09G178700 [Paspalum vaginatum]